MKIEKATIQKRVSELQPHPGNAQYNSAISGIERAALVESIREFGILQAIIITPDGTILSGEQRWGIAKELGYEHVECIVFEGTDQECLYLLVSENKARRESERDPIKRALQYRVLYQYWGIQHGGDRSSDHGERLTAGELAETIGASASNIRKYLRLLDLIEPLQQLVSAGTIGLTVGNRLARLPEEQQTHALQLIRERALEEVRISDCEEIFRILEDKQHGEETAFENTSPTPTEKTKFAKMEKQLQKWSEQLSDEERELFQELLLRFAGGAA